MAIDRKKEIQELEAQIEYVKSAAFAPGFGKVLTAKGKAEQIADLERRIAVQRLRAALTPPAQFQFDVSVDIANQVIGSALPVARGKLRAPCSSRFPVPICSRRRDSAKSGVVGVLRSFARGREAVHSAVDLHDRAALDICLSLHHPVKAP